MEIDSQKGTGRNNVILFQKIVMNLHSKQKGQNRKEGLPLNWVSTRLPIYSSSTENVLKLLTATTTPESVQLFFLFSGYRYHLSKTHFTTVQLFFNN